MVFLTGSLLVSATKAYFTANAAISDNTFSAGTLDIVYGGTASATMTLSDMEPGVWYGDQDYPDGDYQLTISNNNTGTIDAKYRFKEEVATQDLDIYSFLNVKVYRDESGVWVKHYEGPLSGMVLDGSIVSAMNNLAVSDSHLWKFAFQLDPSATDEYQGGNATWNLLVDATQALNPGW